MEKQLIDGHLMSKLFVANHVYLIPSNSTFMIFISFQLCLIIKKLREVST